MKVGLRVPREIEVDDHVHRHDVDTAGEEVSAHQAPSLSILEVVIDAVAVLLLHAGMNVEAGVAELLNLVGKQLHPLGRVAEDDGLVDVELREQGVEAMKLLALLQVRIVLSDSLQSQLLHQINELRGGDVLGLELLNLHGVGSREEHNLLVLGHDLDDLGDDALEVNRQQFVDFIQHEQFAVREICDLLHGQVQDTARCPHNRMYSLVETDDILPDLGTTSGDHGLNLFVLAELLDHM